MSGACSTYLRDEKCINYFGWETRMEQTTRKASFIHCARRVEMRNAYKILVGKPERKRPRGRPRSRWEDNIKMDLKGNSVGGCGLDSSGSGYGPVVGSCDHDNEPSKQVIC